MWPCVAFEKGSMVRGEGLEVVGEGGFLGEGREERYSAWARSMTALLFLVEGLVVVEGGLVGGGVEEEG